jgi:hypothetical protein
LPTAAAAKTAASVTGILAIVVSRSRSTTYENVVFAAFVACATLVGIVVSVAFVPT